MTLPSTRFRFGFALAVGLAAFSIQAPVAQASELGQASSASQPSFPAALALPLPPPPLRIFAITAERRALLNTIRYAEGTWADGDDIGYRIMFGGGLMPSLERHPDRVVRTARYASAAAGAYQFMPFTWNMVSRSLGFSAFGPQVQDQGAVYLIQRRGALAMADQGVFSPQLASKLAPEWASFPTLGGRSFYGQPVKRFHDLKLFYDDNLSRLRDQQSTARVENKPACAPAGSLRCQLEDLEKLGPRSRSQGKIS
ncbi:MAG: glycoside hydrolase family 104 protein [Cyanobacteria bacterium]|nr:glycoside hydrolase family 104 protein [Cyanobacteriota bacterium]MDA1246930.1 glycoside hydrolase family 104 protein [Cyanobacteriota bacterium]